MYARGFMSCFCWVEFNAVKPAPVICAQPWPPLLLHCRMWNHPIHSRQQKCHGNTNCMQWDEKQAYGLGGFFHYNLSELMGCTHSNSFLPLASQNSIVPKIVFEKNGGAWARKRSWHLFCSWCLRSSAKLLVLTCCRFINCLHSSPNDTRLCSIRIGPVINVGPVL